jgi:RND family efflux transporter MFP subunit
MKKIVLIIPLILLMAGGIILLKKRKQAIAETPVAKVMVHAVRTVQPAEGTVSESSRFLAKLESVNTAEIASKLSGRISKVMVVESQQVSRGDLLVTIDDKELRAGLSGLEAQLAAAQTRLESARAQYGRDRALFKAGGLAREKLDLSKVNSSTARAAVVDFEQKIKGQENQLEYMQIKAPFSGTVGTIFLRPGDLAAPGRPLLSLNSPDQKLTFSFMPESDGIAVGQAVRFREGTGTVSNLYTEAKNGLAVAEVRPDRPVNQPRNSFVSIEVVRRVESGCTVPVRSLLHRPGKVTVMVYQKKQFREQTVTVTVRGRDSALITPCPADPVAVAAEAKLSLLPTYGRIRITAGEDNE